MGYEVMKGGGNVSDDIAMVRGGLRPWWRSVGVLLGLPGLLFLVWVWRDTFSHGSQVGVRHTVSQGGGGWIPFAPWMVRLGNGAVVYQRMEVLNDPGEVVIKRDRVTGYLRKGTVDNAWGGVWGSSVEKMDVAEAYVFEARRWWVSFGFVVLGYVVVWLGVVVMWRRRRERRWMAERVVGE